MSETGGGAQVHDRGSANRINIAETVSLGAPIIVAGDDNLVEIGAGTVLLSDDPAREVAGIEIHGHRNQLVVGPNARLNVSLRIHGNDCRMVIGRDCILTFNANLRAGGTIEIGDQTTMVKGALQVHETGSILIGRDCMISTLVYLSVSDIHPIYDRGTGDRINPPASVTIGDHVWLGLRSMVMKGARIDDGSVVAAGAVVSGHVPANVIVAGAPARVQRENVEWRRDFD
jgi:acetyltransferase-like isoleucine patch superfamily enzyme